MRFAWSLQAAVLLATSWCCHAIMQDKYDPNTLWVALNELGEGNIFQVYPRLLAEILLQEEAARQEGDTSEAEKLVLPSDKEWRLQQYFYLVAMQKNLEMEQQQFKWDYTPILCEYRDIKENAAMEPKPSDEAPEEWAPWNLVVSIKNAHAPPPVAVHTTPGPAWDIAQVIKAAYLLSKPPVKVNFEDEQEMRCVYSLIYDVFRCKSYQGYITVPL
ncbi:hypothetical protein MSG28_001458 [Choristoneura fumiferana]|uniref:Uncharacterized protein n=1 Tax=Choristoneura fumiferana TaxID=7141 RepID=A0ACC0KUH6_CHOFU|nr:hypothetical protein MSG28_001458 [Choristoneura fumiferana]